MPLDDDDTQAYVPAMTGAELEAARRQLGLGPNELADWLEMESDYGDAEGRPRGRNKSGNRILEMERGVRRIPGPTATAVRAFLWGYRPEFIRAA